MITIGLQSIVFILYLRLIMFKTHQSAEVFNPLAKASEKYWSYAEIDIQRPWFYVQYSSYFETENYRSMLLFSRIEQLQELSLNQSVKITEVNIVTPPYINKSSNWKMSCLDKIKKGYAKLAGQDSPIYIYELMDGTEILHNTTGADIAQTIKFETVFSLG